MLKENNVEKSRNGYDGTSKCVFVVETVACVHCSKEYNWFLTQLKLSEPHKSWQNEPLTSNCATNRAITLHNFSTSDIILEIKNEISIFISFLSSVKCFWLFRKNCNGPFSFNYLQSLFLQWGNVLEGWRKISFSYQIRTHYFTFSN